MYGQLIPLGGGDTIPLLKQKLRVGRRENCDIVLRFSNVSSSHCELSLEGGYWYVRDLNSSNGTKVNGVRVVERRLDPGAEISIAKHRFRVQYDPDELGATGPPPPDAIPQDIIGKSLLERAGLSHRGDNTPSRRYNVNFDGPGQIKNPNRPV